MKAVLRACALLALIVLIIPAALAGDPPAPKAKSKKAAASAKAAGTEKAPAVKSEAARAPQGSANVPSGSWADREFPTLRPIPATSGTLGLFTMDTGDTLPRKGASISAYANKFSRMPGDLSIVNAGWNVGVGVHDRLSLFLQFEPHRHIHLGQRTQLSFNTGLSNPQFGSTMYRSLLPVVGVPPGYVEDYPFAGFNGGGIGEVMIGFKLGLLSEWRGDAVSLSLRNDFFFPTRAKFTDLLDNEVQSGQLNYGLGLAMSKTFRDVATATLNWGYRFTRDPRSAGVTTMNMADQMRFGAGFLLFPEKRIQFMNEYTGLLFVGNATQNTSVGARDPVDGIWGVRLYPWENVAIDVGYRHMLNLSNHGDRHGFVLKVGTGFWPEKPIPVVNRAPTAVCSADRSSVYAESGEKVRVIVQASDPDGDTLAYAWSATGGRIEGTGAEVRWDSSGTTPGVYTVSARVDDGKGATASCSVDIRVEPRPNRAPTMSCSADRTTVLIGERIRITAVANDPDNDPLTYSWRTNGGQIIGSGSSVQLDTSGVTAGRYTVTGRVDDGRGGAADCSVSIEVQAPPPPPQASKINECFFRLASARVDNVCKRILDDVALRLQNDPRARVVLVGFADPQERRPDRLATTRAENAKKYLGDKGIAATRVDVRAAGGQKGAGKQNRRIDIIWVPEGATY